MCFAFDFFDLLFFCLVSVLLSKVVDVTAGAAADDLLAPVVGAVFVAPVFVVVAAPGVTAAPVVADVAAGADFVVLEVAAVAGADLVVAAVELPAGVVEDCANAVAANALAIRAVTSLLMCFFLVEVLTR